MEAEAKDMGLNPLVLLALKKARTEAAQALVTRKDLTGTRTVLETSRSRARFVVIEHFVTLRSCIFAGNKYIVV